MSKTYSKNKYGASGYLRCHGPLAWRFFSLRKNKIKCGFVISSRGGGGGRGYPHSFSNGGFLKLVPLGAFAQLGWFPALSFRPFNLIQNDPNGLKCCQDVITKCLGLPPGASFKDRCEILGFRFQWLMTGSFWTEILMFSQFFWPSLAQRRPSSSKSACGNASPPPV